MNFEKRQKFSIRKFSVGAASVLIGQFFVGTMANAPVVRANEVTGNTEVNSSLVQSTETKTYEAPATENVEIVQPKTPVTEEATKEAEAAASTEETAKATDVAKAEEVTTETAKTTEATKAEETAKAETPATESKEASKEVAGDKAPAESATPLAEPKGEAKTVDEEETVENPLQTRLESAVAEAVIINEVATKHLETVTDELSGKALSDAIAASKVEIEAGRELLIKEESLKAPVVDLAVKNLHDAIQTVYTEMKRSGHDGNVSYVMDNNAAEWTLNKGTRSVYTPYA